MGLVIFYAKDDKEALQFMMDDPAVKNKIMLAKAHPYGIALINAIEFSLIIIKEQADGKKIDQG